MKDLMKKNIFKINWLIVLVFSCTPCKLTLNSQAQIDLHISGIKHKKAVQGNEQMVPNNKNAEIYCEPCGVSGT